RSGEKFFVKGRRYRKRGEKIAIGDRRTRPGQICRPVSRESLVPNEVPLVAERPAVWIAFKAEEVSVEYHPPHVTFPQITARFIAQPRADGQSKHSRRLGNTAVELSPAGGEALANNNVAVREPGRPSIRLAKPVGSTQKDGQEKWCLPRRLLADRL